ncbi:MAG: glycosyltransferase [Sedimentisphaerales bacterium]|nr:glycosyltransferase [Sedimentisphaerales bacterium]
MNTDKTAINPAGVNTGLRSVERRAPRFSFVMIVLNGMPLIEYSLKAIYDFAHEIIIVEGAVEKCMFAAGADGGSIDGTAEFIESFPDPQGKIRLIRGRWPEKCEMQNEALKYVTGDYVWLVDCDEVYKKDDLEKIKGILRDDPSITQVNFIPDSFWKGFEYIFVSSRFFEEECHYRRLFKYATGAVFTTHRPPTMVWSGRRETTEQTHLLSGSATRNMGIMPYHYSYVFDKQVRQKIELYHRYGWGRQWHVDLQQWYEECFSKWTPENRQEIDSRYPIWTGDMKSRTQVFTGTHPEVMGEFIRRHSKTGAGGTEVASSRDALAGAAQSKEAGRATLQADALEVKNIIWVRPDAIGDAVLSASMLPYIKAKWANAAITVVCQGHIAELYKACPHVDNIVTFERKRALSDNAYRRRVVGMLQQFKPEVSLNSVYSREALTDYFAVNCSAGLRIAHEGDLCNIAAELKAVHDRHYSKLIASDDTHKLELERHLDFLSGLGIAAERLGPVVWTMPEDERYAEDVFRENGLDPDGTIALFAGAQYDCRVYEGYGDAVAEVCAAEGLSIIGLGGGSDYEINERNLLAAGARFVNLSGRTSIRQCASILRRCRVAVGAESGLAHISCAVGTPNVIVLGGGHFGRFMPYSALSSVVCLPLDCYGCNWACRYAYSHCVKDLASSVLREAVRRSLEEPSDRPRVFMQGVSLWQGGEGRPGWKGLEQRDEVEIIPVEAEAGVSEGVSSKVAAEASQVGGEAECDLSIVVCTKDRARLLDRMLGSLEESAGGIVYEVIAVEGDSSDNTLDVLRRHNVGQVFHESRWLGAGRHSWPELYNFGFSQARGKWGMYASDDIVFGPSCISRGLKILERQGEEVAGGIFFYKNLHPTREDWIEFGIDFTHGNKLLMNYGLVRLDCFREADGFDQTYRFYCADTDLCYKLYQNGRQLIPLAGCFVIHDNLLDAQKQVNAQMSARDIELCQRRWRDFVPRANPRPGRLKWNDGFSEAFALPAELERVNSGIEHFWHGLAFFGEGMFADAEKELVKAVEAGCEHRQVLWYLTQARKHGAGILVGGAARAVRRSDLQEHGVWV